MSATLEQVERLIEVGRTGDAKRILAPALSADPDDPDLRVCAARIAFIVEEPGEARNELGAALRVDPTHRLARLLLFELEVDEKRYVEAEHLITQLIKECPDQPHWLALYARLMLLSLHLDKARLLVDEALARDPEGAEARRVDVLLSIVEGYRDRADLQLSDLVAEDPDSLSTAALVVVALVEGKRYREALPLAQQLLRAQPSNEDMVELVVELKSQVHWLALPLWPMQRWGWLAAAVIWVGAMLILPTFRRTRHPWLLGLLVPYTLWVVYSWLYPPIMRRWLRWKGV